MSHTSTLVLTHTPYNLTFIVDSEVGMAMGSLPTLNQTLTVF